MQFFDRDLGVRRAESTEPIPYYNMFYSHCSQLKIPEKCSSYVHKLKVFRCPQSDTLKGVAKYFINLEKLVLHLENGDINDADVLKDLPALRHIEVPSERLKTFRPWLKWLLPGVSCHSLAANLLHADGALYCD